MKIDLLDLKEQYRGIEEEINKAVAGVLASGQYISGPNCKALEEEICAYVGCKRALGVANGTDALVLALKALGVGKGDEVITTPFTFFATAESISAVGATPVFVDIDETTFNIDANKIEEKITVKTKAIMPVHLFGLPADMDKIMALSKEYSVAVIEDAAQAIGSAYHGQKIGTIGDVTTFSFFPTKNLGAYGDGGMIVTDNDQVAMMCEALKVHGSGNAGKRAYEALNPGEEALLGAEEGDTVYNPVKYYNYFVGYNSRLDELQAAILRVKLKHLENWNEQRRKVARAYSQLLDGSVAATPYVPPHTTHVFHQYTLRSARRNEIVLKLKEQDIAAGIYYPIPLHLQYVYKDLGYQPGDFPVAERAAQEVFSIPIYPELSLDNVERIVAVIQSVR